MDLNISWTLVSWVDPDSCSRTEALRMGDMVNKALVPNSCVLP